MANIIIRVGVDDIERLVLGGEPTEEARLEFRNSVLAEYAEAHIKPLENSEQLKKLKAALSAEVDAAITHRFLEKKGYDRYELKPHVKEAMQKEVDAVIREKLQEISFSACDRLDAMSTDVSNRLDAAQKRVEEKLCSLANHVDAESFVADTFTKTLNHHIDKLFRNRPLAEIAEVAEQVLSKKKKAAKK